MNVDNAKSQMRKGMLDYCIMLLLSEKPYYTSDIIQRGQPVGCRRHALPSPNSTEERRSSLVRMAGKHTRSATKVLRIDRRRS